MSTRKLILTALVCGLLILLAGGVKLIQVAGDQPRVAILAPGESARVGDATVTVLAIGERDDVVLVDVEVSGIEGLDAGSGWIVLADGERRESIALPQGMGTDCPVTSDEQPVRCSVAFPAADRVQAVAFARGGEQRQWAPGPG